MPAAKRDLQSKALPDYAFNAGPAPACPTGLIWRMGTGCCALLAVDIPLLQITFRVPVSACPC